VSSQDFGNQIFNHRRKNVKSILVLTLLATVCLACGILGEKKDELTDVSEIKREYAKSKDEAQRKYDGKELTILGKVSYRSEVNPTIRIGDSANTDITIPDIECHFAESDVLFKNVTDNQIIKVKGVLRFTSSGMEIKPCKFVTF
jgi:hypothetical protein